ncbi:MAG: PEP-CTERM/exosortase system-associated acyltransferase, partial [Rhodocyclaceae bacterium]|nr:PEP-CTERM/exosortase system-associated acyltransferase [Rhodocyclaceae bacterium]
PAAVRDGMRRGLDRRIVDTAALDRSRIAEMSRLTVVANHRRRPGEAGC